jgi:hypothetical protein
MNTTATICPTAIHIPAAPAPGCVATLRTTITQDQAGDDVEILSEARRVTLVDSPRGLAGQLPVDLRGAERTSVADELAAFVTREPRGPFVLERLLLDDTGRAVHVEMRILPIDECEQRDLAELLGDLCDPDGGHELATLYAADVEAAWEQRAGGIPLPVCFLEELNPRLAASRGTLAPLQLAA